MVINIVNKKVLKVSYTKALYNETMGKSERITKKIAFFFKWVIDSMIILVLLFFQCRPLCCILFFL